MNADEAIETLNEEAPEGIYFEKKVSVGSRANGYLYIDGTKFTFSIGRLGDNNE